MSSLIEWPSLYGSSYFIPAILVVVLLLALVLLVSRRRRAKKAAGHADPIEQTQILTPAVAAAGAAGALAPPAEAVIAQPLPMTQAVGTAQPVAMAQSVEATQSVEAAQPAPVGRAVLATQPYASSNPMPAASWQTRAAVAPMQPEHVPASAPPPVAAATVVPALADTMRSPAATSMAEKAADVPASSPLPASTSLPPIPDLEEVAPGRRAKFTVKTKEAGPISGIAGDDPLNTALFDILNGWGDLGPEDTKRLDLFRPDRVAAAVAILQVPKSKSTDAKARLSQLRQYASGLELRSAAMIAVAAAADAPPVASGFAPAPAPVILAAPPQPMDLSDSLDITAVAMQTAAAEPEARPLPAAAVAPAVDDAAAGLAAAVAIGAARHASSDPAEPRDASVADAEPDGIVIPDTDYNDLASLWAEPRSLWNPAPEPAGDVIELKEMDAPVYRQVEVRPEFDPEEIPEFMPLGDEGGIEHDGGESPKPPVASSDTYFWDDPPTDPVSRLSVKVDTAEQLLALPADEQVDMTAFLGPSELAATFRATSSPELKRAVIDTLEHIGTPASLNALGNCFEDPDCEIQIYALQAADRLLGVA